MKILHIARDSGFFGFVKETFAEVFPGQNRYWIWGVPQNATPTFAKRSNEVRFVSLYWFTVEMKNDLKWCDVVIIHYMSQYAGRVIQTIPSNVPVIWSGWGADYYHLIPSVSGKLILRDTAALCNPKPKRKIPLNPIRLAKSLVRHMLDRLLYKDWQERALRRVDFFSAPIPEDYKLLKQDRPDFGAEYVQLNYGSVEATMQKGPVCVHGPDILIGNSAKPENNHVEVFNLLEKFGLSGRNLVVPLSYGDTWYRDKIVKIGTHIFGRQFKPLLEFMPIDDYNTTIARCSTVIMNHIRQQALGNITTMIYKGAKVFLNPKNVAFDFFRKRGAFVYPVPVDTTGAEEFFAPLKEDEKEKNREVIESFWGHEIVANNIRRLAQVVAMKRSAHA